MSERALSLHRGRRIVALASLVLTAGYSYYAWTELGFGRWRSPGAAIFPLAVGAIVAVAAIAVLLERKDTSDGVHGASFSLPTGEVLRKLSLVLIAFALYFVAMLYVGHLAASAVFLVAAMALIAEKLSPKIVVYAAVIAIVFQLFFVRFLQVQMPKSVLW